MTTLGLSSQQAVPCAPTRRLVLAGDFRYFIDTRTQLDPDMILGLDGHGDASDR